MRASKRTEESGKCHISGAETLCQRSALNRITNAFINRALTHPRGVPDHIRITIDKITVPIKSVPMLPWSGTECASPDAARILLGEKMNTLGIAPLAMRAAFRILSARQQMRGAALIHASTGKRLEPDRWRGVRVSRFGIHPAAQRSLRHQLSRRGLYTETVREALTLASKVSGHPDILAEICVSDDPDYTTGYIASRSLGYLRIPNIKQMGALNGGRVFFLQPGAVVADVIEYLERTPIFITTQSANKEGSHK